MFPTAAGPLASTLADFNQDGHLDLSVSNTAVDSISVFLGVGDGTFRARTDYTVAGCQPGQTITGDFNRDGHLDLLGTCTLTTSIFVLPGKGDGTFGAPIFTHVPFPIVSGFLDAFVQPLSSADINGDGIPDLALIIQTTSVVGLSTPGMIGQTVTLTGNGDGTFGHLTTIGISPAGTETYAVQLADVNGDGKPDLLGIAFNFDSSGLTYPYTAFFTVSLSDGHGGFQLTHTYPLTGIPQTGMMIADVNADGKLDVVFAGLSIAAILNGANGSNTIDFSGVGVFLGTGNGSFTQSFAISDPQTPRAQLTVGAGLGPVLGTKLPDLVTAVLVQDNNNVNVVNGLLQFRANNGDGTFAAPQDLTAPSPVLPFSLSIGDLNADGFADIVSFNFTEDLFTSLFFGPVDVTKNIDAIGQTLASYPAATASVLLGGSGVASFTSTNAASFQAGSLASASIASGFGSNLASSSAAAATLPLPLSLGGTSISVVDALGVARPAPLFYASPLQINYEIPDGTAAGLATIKVATPTGIVTQTQQIVAVQPGIFNASGIAIAQVFTYNGSAGPVVTSTLVVNSQGQFSAAPVSVGTGSQSAYLILYGTGIRNHQSAVTATIGSTAVTAAYAGPAGAFVGEDQINILLPQSLHGAGLVNVTLSADGLQSNPVQLLLQ